MTRITLDPLELLGDRPALCGVDAEWDVQNDGVQHLRGHGIEVGRPNDLVAGDGPIRTTGRGACAAMEKAITGRDLPFNEHAPFLHPGVKDYWAGEWTPEPHRLGLPTTRAAIRGVELLGINGSSAVAIAAFYVQGLYIDGVNLLGAAAHIVLVGCDRVTIRDSWASSIMLNSCTRVRIERCGLQDVIAVEEACADVDVIGCVARAFRSNDSLCRRIRLTDTTFTEPRSNPGAIQIAGGRGIRATRCKWPSTSHAWSAHVPAEDFIVRDCTHMEDGKPAREPARY